MGMSLHHIDCREARPLLPLFFDGELDGRQMRRVALHSTRCPECEQELHRFERLQDVMGDWIDSEIEHFDLSGIWSGVAPRLAGAGGRGRSRVRAWREASAGLRRARRPLVAALAAAAVIVFFLWRFGDAPVERQVADNSVILDSLDSHVDTLALLSEPETNTLVLWVADDGGESGGLR